MDFELLGVCLDRKILRRGSDRAPHELRKVFPELETFIDGIDLREHWLKDLGNIVDPRSYDDIINQMKSKLNSKFPIILGGDHSISFSGVKTINPKVFVSFDAHPDCEPLDLSFRSVTRIIAEDGYNSYLYGVRSFSKEESKYLKNSKNIKIASLDDLKNIKDPVYLSIDFDVLDPSIMPSVSFPEPNGLTFSEILGAIRVLAKNLVAVDFVELLPTENTISTVIAGKLVYSTLAEIVKSRLQ